MLAICMDVILICITSFSLLVYCLSGLGTSHLINLRMRMPIINRVR